MRHATDMFSQLESLIASDLGGRGVTSLFIPGDLKSACQSLLNAEYVVVCCGFYITKTQGGETDGPVGTAIFLKSLEHIGIRTLALTDEFHASVLEAAIHAAGGSTPVLSVQPGQEKDVFEHLVQDGMTHLCAIEQMGAAADGYRYNMAAQPLPNSADFDWMFDQCQSHGITSIGVGDGGNEIGMGKLANSLRNLPAPIPLIHCRTATDYVVVCGVSNWGAAALAAGLMHLTGRTFHWDVHLELRILEATVAAGAVDGRTGEPACTVDGLSFEEYVQVPNRVWDMVTSFRAPAV